MICSRYGNDFDCARAGTVDSSRTAVVATVTRTKSLVLTVSMCVARNTADSIPVILLIRRVSICIRKFLNRISTRTGDGSRTCVEDKSGEKYFRERSWNVSAPQMSGPPLLGADTRLQIRSLVNEQDKFVVGSSSALKEMLG